MSPSNSTPDTDDGLSNSTDVYDLICLGFGPASLAIAVALQDLHVKARVLFLEKQSSFVWHAGMLIPSAKMQISFLKDLATFRDPRSHFTFLNYLKSKGRLEAFTNLGTFLPLREEFNDYLTWAAEHFEDNVRYDTEVLSVQAIAAEGKSPVNIWKVTCQCLDEQRVMSFHTKRLIVALGGAPRLPRGLTHFGPKVVHSSHYLRTLSEDCGKEQPLKKIGVIGGGQSAAEIFYDLAERFSTANIRLYTAGTALKPSDDSPL